MRPQKLTKIQSNQFKNQSDIIFRTYQMWTNILARSFDSSEPSTQRKPIYPSNLQNHSFGCSGVFLWFYWNAEPSTLLWRAFVIATPSPRWFDNEPSATSVVSWRHLMLTLSSNRALNFHKTESLARTHTSCPFSLKFTQHAGFQTTVLPSLLKGYVLSTGAT